MYICMYMYRHILHMVIQYLHHTCYHMYDVYTLGFVERAYMQTHMCIYTHIHAIQCLTHVLH